MELCGKGTATRTVRRWQVAVIWVEIPKEKGWTDGRKVGPAIAVLAEIWFKCSLGYERRKETWKFEVYFICYCDFVLFIILCLYGS